MMIIGDYLPITDKIHYFTIFIFIITLLTAIMILIIVAVDR